MKFQSNFRTLCIYIVSLCVLVIGIGNLYLRLKQKPLADDGVIWQVNKSGVVAESIRNQSPAERAGLLPGDKLQSIEINGQSVSVSTVWQVQYYLDEKIGVGGSVTYIVERFNPLGISKGLWAVEIQEVAQKTTRLALDIYLGCIGITYLIIGLYVFYKKGQQNSQGLHFYIICLLSFVYLFFSHSGNFSLFDKTIYWFDSVALIVLCPTFLHFCVEFPCPSYWMSKHRWSLYLLYIPACVMVCLETTDLVLGKYNTGVLKLRSGLDQAEIIHFILYFLASTAVVIATFIQTKVTLIRQQIKWIVWGLSLGILPWICFYVYPRIIGIEVSPLMIVLAISPTIFMPLSFGYSIVRYRLMDVDIIVRRSMTYALAMLSVVILFMLGVVKSAEWMRELFPNISGATMTLLQVGVMSLGVTLYNPLKNWLQERIDRIFYGAQYDYRQGIADFGRALSATIALPDLLDSLSERLSEMLDVNEVAIFINNSENNRHKFRLAYSKGIISSDYLTPEIESTLLKGETIIKPIAQLDFPFLRGYLGTKSMGLFNISDNASTAQLSYFFPCVVRDQVIAAIGLGQTQDHTLLTSEDTELLHGLAPYVAVAIENSLLYQTEQERITELAILKEFNENIIESINVGILAVDLNGYITNWNSALEELFHVSRMDAEGNQLSQIFDEDLMRTLSDVAGGFGWGLYDVRNIYRYRMITQDGHSLVLNICLSPLKAKDNIVTGTLISIEDVTSKVRLEEQLRENDKLSSIGLLAAGVAHEVNTPLTGISSYTQMLLNQIPEADAKHNILEKIRRQTLRASDIVNNLLNFSRTRNTKFVNLDICKLLDDTLQLVEPQLRNTNIKVVRTYLKNLPLIYGHEGKLQQVFMNLILNARDAMPNGGKLNIVTKLEDNSVIVEFLDTGEGIQPENITKIYDPFFTTKSIGQGTGLGLAVSYGIIQEHTGHIFVESEPGKGTCFRIKLPCVSLEQLMGTENIML